MFNRSSIQNHKKSVIFIGALTLLAGVAANGAGIINIPTAGYLLCVNSKTKVVTHPGTATCPKGTKGLVVGSKGQDGAPGLTGATGLNGQNGLNGMDGKTLWNGTKDPENTWGSPGDMFINSVTKTLFGPKDLDETWPVGVSMVGPKGDQGPIGLPGLNGANGSNGANGANGATGPQGLIGLTGATAVAEPLTSGSNCIGTKCTFKVGDVGPAGGIIFYVDYFNQYSGFNYLEVAPATCGGKTTWASESITSAMPTNWSNRTVGAGADLTARIKSALPRDTSDNNAAYFATSCTAKTNGGSPDWFLGSVGEMKLLNDNLQGLAGLLATNYWTSSENGSTNAWFVVLSNSSITNNTKSNLFNVIPIRSF